MAEKQLHGLLNICPVCRMMEASKKASSAPPLVLSQELTDSLLPDLLYHLAAGDLVRLACTCHGLQDLVFSLDAATWREAAVKHLPEAYPPPWQR